MRCSGRHTPIFTARSTVANSNVAVGNDAAATGVAADLSSSTAAPIPPGTQADASFAESSAGSSTLGGGFDESSLTEADATAAAATSQRPPGASSREGATVSDLGGVVGNRADTEERGDRPLHPSSP
jgi:hypothetical protein